MKKNKIKAVLFIGFCWLFLLIIGVDLVIMDIVPDLVDYILLGGVCLLYMANWMNTNEYRRMKDAEEKEEIRNE